MDRAAVMNVCSRLIIGWSIADHMRTELVTDALDMAILRRQLENNTTLLHSIHGTVGDELANAMSTNPCHIGPLWTSV
ncbi:hypothetical protein [Amycolatopsis sp. NPDC059021]|uniref:hypothetical protein n=1 Tax=Amycolatopsis sp. NPDC059021 TaxID=3346704 RepID=UPI0036701CB7